MYELVIYMQEMFNSKQYYKELRETKKKCALVPFMCF